MRYKALIVQDRSYCSPEVLQKIDELSGAGVPVIRCDRGEKVGERLAKYEILPDIALQYIDGENRMRIANIRHGRVGFFHRQTPTTDIYFLYNHSENPFDGLVTFRSSNNYAERWEPKPGIRKSLEMDVSKTINLKLEPYESTFIVLQ